MLCAVYVSGQCMDSTCQSCPSSSSCCSMCNACSCRNLVFILIFSLTIRNYNVFLAENNDALNFGANPLSRALFVGTIVCIVVSMRRFFSFLFLFLSGVCIRFLIFSFLVCCSRPLCDCCVRCCLLVVELPKMWHHFHSSCCLPCMRALISLSFL